MLTVSDNHIVLGGGGGGGSTTFAGLSDKATADIPAINTPLATALDAKEATSNKKTDVDANKTSDTFFPTVKAVFDWVSGLFVRGDASSTDNAIVRFYGTTGKIVRNSGVVVDDNGNVGIGTTTPEAKLQIENGGGLASGGLYIHASSNSGYSVLSVKSEYGDSGGGNLVTVANYDSTRFVIDNTGNTGIGTANPAYKLDVNGTSRFVGNATFNGQIIDNVGSSGADGQVLKKVGGLVIWANP